jgi:hypothetical protein
MKQMLISIAKTLVQVAGNRAELVMRKQADQSVLRGEDYTANAGGWN